MQTDWQKRKAQAFGSAAIIFGQKCGGFTGTS